MQKKINKKSSILRTSYFKLQRGFTLIEVLAALFLLTVGTVGAITLVNKTIAFFQVNSSQLVASYLAQEGLEIVKNIRDTNLLKIHLHPGENINWSDGLTGCVDGCEGDYNDYSLASSTERYLKIDGGFYKYSAKGQDTPFTRKIRITPINDHILEVRVEVSWQEWGRTHQVSAQENLYKWW